MSNFKVAVFGQEHLEKRTVLYQLANPDYQQTAERSFSPIIGCEYYSLESGRLKVQLWALSGDRRYAPMAPVFLRGANLGMCCLDLSQMSSPTDCSHLIADYIEVFEAENPQSPMILVVTNTRDCPQQQNIVTALRQNYSFAAVFIKPNEQPAEMMQLRGFIYTQAEQAAYIHNQPMPHTPYFTIRNRIPETTSLYYALNQLARIAYIQSLTMKQQIEYEVNTLVTGLMSAEATDKHQLTLNFLQRCQAIMPQKHHVVLRAVFAVAISALIIATAAAIGFGLGFTLATLFSPAALVITGMISALSFALCTALHAIPYTYDKFFKPSPLETQVAQVAELACCFNPDENCYA